MEPPIWRERISSCHVMSELDAAVSRISLCMTKTLHPESLVDEFLEHLKLSIFSIFYQYFFAPSIGRLVG